MAIADREQAQCSVEDFAILKWNPMSGTLTKHTSRVG